MSSSYIENNLIHLHSENVELRRQQQGLYRDIGRLVDRVRLGESKIYSLQRGMYGSKRRHFGQIKHQNRTWSRVHHTFVQQDRFNVQQERFNGHIIQQLQQLHQSINELCSQMPSPHAKSVLEWLNKLSQPQPPPPPPQ
jgi:hypothetical protein